MSTDPLLKALLSTLDDQHLSRTERKALRLLLKDLSLSQGQRLSLQRALVDAVAQRAARSEDRDRVEWLGDALALLAPSPSVSSRPSRAFFGPEDPMVESVEGVVRASQMTLDIAVFTITDDRLSRAILAVAQRGVAVRILTDDDKSLDRGSDVSWLDRHGIAILMDNSPFHFHHKFCVADRRVLLNGSYNWTRGADQKNRENLLITEERGLVARYQAAFDDLWTKLS